LQQIEQWMIQSTRQLLAEAHRIAKDSQQIGQLVFDDL
jgi:hypothetical protein